MMITSAFQKPVFIFKGSALYQIHLVKAEDVRPFIPKEFRIDQTLGYTPGGFFLANYEDSPFGAFDELVVIAGIVRKDRSSSAWAAKVLVNNDEARDHGRKEFGLPSQVANFSKKTKLAMLPQRHNASKAGGFLNINGLIPNSNCSLINNYNHIQIREINKDDGRLTDSCNVTIKTSAAPGLDTNRHIIGPQIKLSLPSLSGLTEYNPHLLHYTCQIETRVRVVPAAKISSEQLASEGEVCESARQESIHGMDSSADKRNLMIRTVMQSKPIVAFEFSSMKMIVGSPTVVSRR